MTGGAKRYPRDGRDQPVFEALDLAVEAGEVFALLGPSGCGKSTLLRVLAGLESPSAGRVEVGHDGAAAAAAGAAVGIVFQDALLLPWLTVAENVGLGLRYRANRAARAAAPVAEAVDQELATAGVAP